MPSPRVYRIEDNAPMEAFVGDVVVRTLRGEHLDRVTGVRVEPAAKGITAQLGEQSETLLTLTLRVDPKTYPGEKRILLLAPAGESNPVPFLVMM